MASCQIAPSFKGAIEYPLFTVKDKYLDGLQKKEGLFTG